MHPSTERSPIHLGLMLHYWKDIETLIGFIGTGRLQPDNSMHSAREKKIPKLLLLLYVSRIADAFT